MTLPHSLELVTHSTLTPQLDKHHQRISRTPIAITTHGTMPQRQQHGSRIHLTSRQSRSRHLSQFLCRLKEVGTYVPEAQGSRGGIEGWNLLLGSAVRSLRRCHLATHSTLRCTAADLNRQRSVLISTLTDPRIHCCAELRASLRRSSCLILKSRSVRKGVCERGKAMRVMSSTV